MPTKVTVPRVEPFARSVMRIVIGFTYSCHGVQKLFGALGGMNGHGATAHLLTVLWIAGVIETFGGALLVLGLFTSPVAFVVCGEMAVAYFTQHAPRGHFPIRNGGELAVVYCFVFLYLIFAGGGPISLDRALRR
ncbi:MAG: DoxX family protein [Terriglobia bacterium]